MKYQITFCTSKAEWERAVSSFSEANFLQSYNWGAFQEQLGKSVIRLYITKNDVVVAVVCGVVETAKRGTYLAIAGGPLLDWNDSELVIFTCKRIAEQARALGCVFVRLRPQVLDSLAVREILHRCTAHESPMHLTADLTLQLDLKKDESQLLAEMRKNTRSAIKKADKVGITTHISQDQTEIRAFYREQEKVAKRQGFVPFSYDFLYKQFSAFVKDDQVLLVHAVSAKGELLATAFILFYNNEAVYHYGISTEANATLPGSYACQWRAIAEARKRGCTRYNFWGIAPKEDTRHRFAGVSLFKRGFGGNEIQYLPAHDIPLHGWYWLTYLFELVRKKRRGLG